MANIFTDILLPILVIFVILTSSVYIGNFFNISLGTYLGYILWFAGLTILYFILPKQKVSVFMKS